MPTLDQVRAAIVGKLNGITGIGRVHDYERYARQDGDFRNLYLADAGSDKVIRGWYVRRLSTAQRMVAIGRMEMAHGWLVRGFMAISDTDASEKVFDGLVDAVLAAFRTDETLGGVVSTTFSPEGEGMKLEESAPVLFAGVLCHSARLRLGTWHYL